MLALALRVMMNEIYPYPYRTRACAAECGYSEGGEQRGRRQRRGGTTNYLQNSTRLKVMRIVAGHSSLQFRRARVGKGELSGPILVGCAYKATFWAGDEQRRSRQGKVGLPRCIIIFRRGMQ